MAADLHRTIDTLWRMEAPKVLAVLTRMLRDLDQAEELAQDALVAALEHWPREGLPDNPAAWWMATAKRRAIDRLRQRQLHQRKHADIAFELEGQVMAGPDSTVQLDDAIGDDLLRLMFIACHPVLPADSRVALTLRLLGGLSTAEIARAFLQPEATVAQRIVRAKRTLAAQRVAFEAPAREDLPERVDAVLDVLYLIFNEGYSASAGQDWMRPALCAEALRLGRVLAGLMPREPEAFGLLALMELQASRTAARALPDGTPVLLEAQDRARWDRLQIARGLQALERALRLGGADAPYTLQAAIAACHARALRSQDTDWPRIAGLYARLAQVAPSPVVELNRAVALGRAAGAQAGLALADTLLDEAALREYPALPAVRGDLLERLGRLDEARACFEQAAALTRNAREAAQMRARAAACATSG
ncbi:sigma-70 family RNA polymerase sigma factor [Pseudoxanthomonas sp. X-1]|uniref:RNA polymerase sigma factor n=1 Tax=Pseudoxanthomonas sp. X-1 TaxID=2571115 RepID=UPI00110AD307|nr:sigma-70 family RNA polymerase sigma factor [Pseudoxanthomonas sp. X-1]TMN17995.1 sigma-70 family RNA polymerase sigma factor [Pseudoxanthomonas sp. X-1]UAY74272.1 sigma-70 family RNA polymerase sigma factor [Pseudoxanthomonas sp. X-1]